MDINQALSAKQQSMIPIAALASMTGTGIQLYFHLGAAMNTGLSEAQMHAFIAVLKAKVGQEKAEGATAVLCHVLSSRAG